MHFLELFFGNLPAVLVLVGPLLIFIAIAGNIETPVVAFRVSKPWQRSLLIFLGIVILLLSTLPTFSDTSKETIPNLNGEWEITIHTSQGNTGEGFVTIQQDKESPLFEIRGEVDGPENFEGKKVTFETIMGVIQKGRVYFMYRNINDEIGIAQGILTQNNPQKFEVKYDDLVGYDKNGDPSGIMELVKKR